MAAVWRCGAWGYIDKNGKFIIPPQFDQARAFRDGLAPVKTSNGWGFIDKNGQNIIPLNVEPDSYFSEGVAVISVDNGKACYLDKRGQILVIPPQIRYLGSFHEGLAKVGGKLLEYGYIDKNFQVVILPQFEWVGDFSKVSATISVSSLWQHHVPHVEQSTYLYEDITFVLGKCFTVPYRIAFWIVN